MKWIEITCWWVNSGITVWGINLLVVLLDWRICHRKGEEGNSNFIMEKPHVRGVIRHEPALLQDNWPPICLMPTIVVEEPKPCHASVLAVWSSTAIFNIQSLLVGLWFPVSWLTWTAVVVKAMLWHNIKPNASDYGFVS